MKYKCADDLYQVLFDRMEANPFYGREASEWFGNDPLTQEAIGFLRVYNDALNNSPDGVVGVGRITYAEKMLISAQKGVN